MPDNIISDIKRHIRHDLYAFFMHCFCSQSKDRPPFWINVHGVQTSVTFTSPHWLIQKHVSRVRRKKPDAAIQTIFLLTSGDFKLFTLDYISQRRSSHVRGDFWNTHRNVFWRNCVTGPRGSWGHMYTFQASCNCAPALISSMLLGTRQKAKPGRLDRTVQSDTDRARDKRTGLWYTLTEWKVFAHSFSSFARILCGYRTVITWQLWLYRK